VGEKAVRTLYAKTSKQFPTKQDEVKIMLLMCFLFIVLAGKCVRCLINYQNVIYNNSFNTSIPVPDLLKTTRKTVRILQNVSQLFRSLRCIYSFRLEYLNL
jgi:hypothetical protein